MEEYLEKYRLWLVMKNYAKRTQKCYLSALKNYWIWCEKMQKSQPNFKQKDAVQVYLVYRFEVDKVAWQTVNGDYSGIRLFYVNILGREWDEDKLPRPRKEKSLPKVVSREQIQLLMEHAVMFKHQVFFALLYSSGLRLGEALRLKTEDIDSQNMQIRVLEGKGKKDRFTILSAEMLELLRFYFIKCRPTNGLIFNGKVKGEAWSERAAQRSFKLARRAAGLPEFITAHCLRHSFASHSLENGTDLVTLQQLLGHKYIKTTVRYIHLDVAHYQRIKNPADKVIAWDKLFQKQPLLPPILTLIDTTLSDTSSDALDKNLSENTSLPPTSVKSFEQLLCAARLHSAD
jgi:integrase/recombinase XerD